MSCKLKFQLILYAIAGTGAYGQRVNRHYTAWHQKKEHAGCNGFLGFKCDPKFYEQDGGYTSTDKDIDCYGSDGIDGSPGADWNPTLQQ